MRPVRGGEADRYSSRRHHLHEWRRGSLWLWPAVAAVGAWVAASLVVAYAPATLDGGRLFSSNLDDARALLGTVATAILTFTGVVFSITLVALQMASSQYSPRVLRNFVRKPVTKLALATFIATFVYSLSVLARIGTTPGRGSSTPQVAVGLSYVLVMACLFVFVAFVHSTVRSIRVTYIIEDIAHETLASLERTFPPSSATTGWVRPDLGEATATVCLDHRSGVLTAPRPTSWSAWPGPTTAPWCSSEPGSYLVRGTPIIEVHGGDPPPADEVLICLDLSPARTLYQDARYGIRQLVDIAIRALSPAVNDPTTAVQVLDRLKSLLAVVAGRPDPSGTFLDADGVIRLVVTPPSWVRLVTLSFTEVARYGADSPQVSRKLLAVYGSVTGLVGAERAAAVEAHRAWLVGEVGRVTADPEARQRGRSPPIPSAWGDRGAQSGAGQRLSCGPPGPVSGW